jgi:hypothetical protein
MAKEDMFTSATRLSGDRAGVFEYDGETGYFYLYDTKGANNRKVVAAIRIMSEVPDFDESDVEIRWDASGNKVGLYIKRRLWAAFDVLTGSKYGGDYRFDALPDIPSDVLDSFGGQ